MSDKKEKNVQDVQKVKQKLNDKDKRTIESSTDNKEHLLAEMENLRTENAKLKDSFLRAYAESENIKKRCQQEIEKNSKYAVSSFAKELLSVADNLQRAVAAAGETDNEQCLALLQGVKMTQDELTHVLAKFGIKKVDSLGKVFDPNYERVVQEVEDTEKPAGTIISELQSAYMINDRILREAMVIVTKKGNK